MAATSETPRILLLGSTGQLGWELCRALACVGELTATSDCGRYGQVVDLSNPDSLKAAFESVRPAFVVNAAAYTAVDNAESDQALAHTVNCSALGVIGELAKKQGAGVIHYSTDFVFSGDSDTPYRETDGAAPLSVYGRTKLEGERALVASGADALIFRTSWVYGRYGNNFLNTMLRLFREREALAVVDDQVGSPTWTRMLAEVSGQILAQLVARTIDLSQVRGLYHLSAGGETSWYGFAQTILDASGESCKLRPITTAEYPTAATRPPYSVLDNLRFRETFALALPHWQFSLEQCMEAE